MNDIALPALEVRDFRLVLALAEAKTTACAAKRLHLTQPAVSRALSGLEQRLGVALFVRTSRGLALTPAGERVVDASGPLLASLRELERELRRPPSERVRIRVVCECYTAYHWLPSTLNELRRGEGGFEIALALEHTADPMRALEHKDIDAALLTTSVVKSAEIAEQPLFSDEIAFVLAPQHPLAKKRTLTPDDLVRHGLITCQTPGPGQIWFMRKVFGRVRPRLRVEVVPLTEALLDMARAGLGIAVLSEWMASGHLGRGDLLLRRLSTGPLLRPWRLAFRRELGEAGPRLQRALLTAAPRSELGAGAPRGRVSASRSL